MKNPPLSPRSREGSGADLAAPTTMVQKLSGMRPGEVVIMRPMDVDRSRDDVWIYTPASHKMAHRGKSWRIVLGPKAQKYLAKYLLKNEKDWCFWSKCRNCYTSDSYRRYGGALCCPCSLGVTSLVD